MLINLKHLQKFPEPSKWSQFGSLGYTTIDTLHKEG